MKDGEFKADDNTKQLKAAMRNLKQNWATLSTDDKLLKMRKILSRLINGGE